MSCDLAWNFTREIAVGEELEMTVVSSRVVLDVHLAMVVDPQSTNDDVVHRRRHFTPCVVVVGRRKQQVSYTCRYYNR